MNPQASPWDRSDVLRWSVAVLVGGSACAAAWWLASGRLRLDEQVPYASVAVAGLLVAGYAHLSWLLRGRRAIGLRRLALLGEPVRRTSPVAAAGRTAGPVFVAVPGRTRYHRVDCPLVDGRATVAGARSVHEAAQRRPCGICGAGRDDRP
ncbi:MAG TPA: hypothetical protein VHL53_09710 [Acidimicrobiia bacterium]|nr:hypothetical protein [Acidimicrobiia bacterium]